MLEHLRTRAAATLGEADSAFLATCGPAGPLVSCVACRPDGLCLRVAVPAGSDHLFNLELDRTVAVATGRWELRGTATVVDPGTQPPERAPAPAGLVVVEVRPRRLTLIARDGLANTETIDF
ncbi:MAG: pyridoxamine 5'-phosphate oxidase family protein [Chloroflexota bacterium]